MTDTLPWSTWTDHAGFIASVGTALYVVEPDGSSNWQWGRWNPRAGGGGTWLLYGECLAWGLAPGFLDAQALAQAHWSAERASIAAHEPLHAALARAEAARDDAARELRRAPKLEKHDASLRVRAAAADLQIARWNLADAEQAPA